MPGKGPGHGMATVSDVITAQGLMKTFGRTRALDGLDLVVPAGQVHGFLGPNGAGKSTTIRILLGLIRRDAGRVRVLGGDPWSDATQLHRSLAYVPGDVTLWPNLTGGEVIDLLIRMRGGTRRAEPAGLIERFELDPTKKARTYSTGNRQKVALVAALAAAVDLLILDEPTSGLDPLMEAVFQQCVTEAAADGRTVLLSSHVLAEVEALCDRVTIVRRGRAVESGSLVELRHLTRTAVRADLVGAPSGLGDLPGVHDVQVTGRRLRCEVDTDRLDPVLVRLAAIGTRGLVVAPPTLEQLFLRHYADMPAGTPVGSGGPAVAGTSRRGAR